MLRVAVESGQGLHAEYTTERQWGVETRRRVDRRISTAAMDHAWHPSTPQKFRARWSGFVVVDRPGWYTFATTSDDGSTVAVNGLLVVDNSGDHIAVTETGRIRLSRGAHRLIVSYEQSGFDYEMAFAWAPEGAEPTQVPRWALWTTPVTAERAAVARVLATASWVVLVVVLAAAVWPARRHLRRQLPTVLRTHWPLLLILVLGASFRLQYLQLPLADAHGWRQIFNADVARHFSEHSLNIWYPRVSWGGGGEAYVSMEFPLLPWLAGVLFRFLGEQEILCRALAIVFSLATIIGVYGLANSLWGLAAARGAAFLLAISPSAVFFGRAFISDTPMVCFSVFGVWGFARYVLSGSRSSLAWGTAAGALAGMVKLPAVIIFAPIVWLAYECKGWAFLRDRRLVTGLAAMFLLTAAWYGHGEILFHRTSLGVAIFHSAGGYSADVMEGSGPVTLVSSWNTWNQLRNPEYYETLADRFWRLHFTPFGCALIAIGAITSWRAPYRRLADVWFAAAASFILLAAEGNRWHEFYQLPILLPAGLYFGLGARPLFNWEWLSRLAPYRLASSACGLALVIVALESFEYSRVVPELFRPHRLRLHPIAVGQTLQEITPPDALLVTVEYTQFGGNSPVLLYHARRVGWSFDATAITPEVVERLRTRFGATHFVTLIWPELVARRPDLVNYLEMHEQVLDAGDTAIFALHPRDDSGSRPRAVQTEVVD